MRISKNMLNQILQELEQAQLQNIFAFNKCTGIKDNYTYFNFSCPSICLSKKRLRLHFHATILTQTRVFNTLHLMSFNLMKTAAKPLHYIQTVSVSRSNTPLHPPLPLPPKVFVL
jgi:hypothetical protein